MADLIKLVRTYRFTAGLSERLRLMEEIVSLIAPELRVFVFGSIGEHAAQNALQEVLKAIATNLRKFEGNTAKEFWVWCYNIARGKLNDRLRKQPGDRTLPMSPQDLWKLMEASAQDAPMTMQNRKHLEYAINLLTAHQPECSELLWRHYVIGLDYAEIAGERNSNPDAMRVEIARCLDEAKTLTS